MAAGEGVGDEGGNGSMDSIFSLLPFFPSLLAFLSTTDPLLIWAWYARGLATMQAFCCIILARQVKAIPTSTGIMPVKARFDRIRADFPSWRRFFFYPSWLHLHHSDTALQLYLYASAIVGWGLAWSGAWSRLGFFILWSCYLSYANVMNFMYPWDALQLEMGFLALLMPPLEPVWMTQGSWPKLVSAVPPLWAFSMRYLCWRLMFGFGKFKFEAGRFKITDLSYLHGFLINQPLPTVPGWLMHHLPMPLHICSYLFLWIVEIPGPFLYFFCGAPRLLGALLIVALQVGIQLTGTFGFFNAMTTVLSLSLCDLNSSLLDDFRWDLEVGSHASWMRLALNMLLAFLLLVHCVFIPFNSWCSNAFLYWPALNFPEGIIGRVLRFLLPFHVSHAFGVFFSCSSPATKWMPVIEGSDAWVASDDGDMDVLSVERQMDQRFGATRAEEVEWKPYTYSFMQSNTRDTPRFVAPYHPRMEHAILYEAMGLGPQTMLQPMTSGDPYEHQTNHMLEWVCCALLRGNTEVEKLFRDVPFGSTSKSNPNSKVKALRVAMYLLTPTSIGEWLRTGEWYHKRYSHLHVPIITLQSVRVRRFGIILLREPEVWHPEFVIWQHRAQAVQKLLSKLRTTAEQEYESTTLAAHTDVEVQEIRRLQAKHATPYGSIMPTSNAKDGFDLDTLCSATFDDSSLPVSAFQSCIILREDVARFWHEFVQPLQSIIQTLRHKGGEDEQLDAAYNGSRHAGLDDSILLRAENRPFRVDLPNDLSEREGGVDAWTLAVHEAKSSNVWQSLNISERYRMEMILARLTLLMVHRLVESNVYHGPAPDEPTRTVDTDTKGITPMSTRLTCKEKHLHLPSYYHLYIYAQHLIGFGEDAYISVLRHPSSACEFLSSYSLESCMFFQGIFHERILAFQARKRRIMQCFAHPNQMVCGGPLPGFFTIYYTFMKHQFKPRQGKGHNSNSSSNATGPMQDESWPHIRRPASMCDHWHVTTDGMPERPPGNYSNDDGKKRK